MANRYRWGDFVLDLDSYRLERGGVPLSLEPKAFNLLALMVGRPGHVFTKQEIFESLWADTAVTDHALTRVVAQLRRVIGDEARQARYLETVPTRGYRWIHPVETGEALVAVVEPEPVAAQPIRWTLMPRLGAAAVLGLVALMILGWAQRNAPAAAVDAGSPSIAATSIAWPVQLTTHGGLDLHPAFSPTGDGVAFVSDRSGAFEIYVRGFGGAGVDTPLTADGGQNVQPAWSPDGRVIAFHSYRHGGIWVVPARGGPARQVAEVGSKPAWSPDGQYLAFQSDEHADASPSGYGAQSGSTLWLADADGSNLRPLTRNDRPSGGHSAPAWSANGKFVAFSVFEGGPANGIWIVDVRTGETSVLHAGNGLYESVFARDRSALFVAGGAALITRLPVNAATGRLSGSPEVIPIAGVPGVRGLSLSPDGRRLAFAGLSLDSQIWKQPLRGDGAPAGAATALTSDTSRRNSRPVISPDATRVAYVSTRKGQPPNVWVMDVNGRSPLQLTSDDTPDHQPMWFRDGRRVAYVSSRNQAIGLWAVDVATRREELLFRPAANGTPLQGRLGELQLSPSMTHLAFSLMTPPTGRRAMYVTAIDQDAPRVVGPDHVSAGYPAWSPDERYLAVEVKDAGATAEGGVAPLSGSMQAGLIEVASGSLRLLTRERGQTWVRSWSPDGRRVAVAALRNGVWSLRAIDVASGRQREVYSAGSPRVFVRYPDWSPRGDMVVFERGEMRANIWTLAIQPAVATAAR